MIWFFSKADMASRVLSIKILVKRVRLSLYIDKLLVRTILSHWDGVISKKLYILSTFLNHFSQRSWAGLSIMYYFLFLLSTLLIRLQNDKYHSNRTRSFSFRLLKLSSFLIFVGICFLAHLIISSSSLLFKKFKCPKDGFAGIRVVTNNPSAAIISLMDFLNAFHFAEFILWNVKCLVWGLDLSELKRSSLKNNPRLNLVITQAWSEISGVKA